MAIRFDSGDSFNNFFNTSLGKKQNGGTNIFNSINLNDYSSLKTGTYKKLLNSYFEKNNMGDKKDAIKDNTIDKLMNNTVETDKVSKEILDNSQKVSKAVNELAEVEYEESNRDKINKNISSFVNSYNKVLDGVEESKDTDLITKGKWMTNYTKSFKDGLRKIGITINDKNRLEIDNEVLENAKINTLKEMFVGKSSFGNNLVTISAIDTYL